MDRKPLFVEWFEAKVISPGKSSAALGKMVLRTEHAIMECRLPVGVSSSLFDLVGV